MSERCPSTRPPASRTASRSGTAQRCSIASTSAELPSGSSSSSPAATASATVGASASMEAPRSAPAVRALLASDAEPDQGPDRSAQLGPLLIVEIRHAQHRDVVAVSHHEHGIDDPDLPDIAETGQLFGDPALEQVVVREADHECLDGSDGHVFLLVRMGHGNGTTHPERSGRRSHRADVDDCGDRTCGPSRSGRRSRAREQRRHPRGPERAPGGATRTSTAHCAPGATGFT